MSKKHLKKKRQVHIAIIVVLVAVLVAGTIFMCVKSTQPDPLPVFASLDDVPGVTDYEIKTIKKLREDKTSFVYGMCLSTETFLDANNDIGGFSALFCEWLTELIGIPFEPAIYEWDELNNGLANGTIDFSGELTPTIELRKTNIMTDAIAARMIKYYRIVNTPSLDSINLNRPLQIASLYNTVTANKVTPYLNHYYNHTYVDNYSEAYDLLKDGSVDVFIGEGSADAFFDPFKNIVSEDFIPRASSSVSLSTQNPDLTVIITVIQKTLENGSIRTLYNLYKQGYNEYRQHKLSLKLTSREKAYLREHTIIPFAAEFDNYPKSFYNTNEKEWQGIAFDVLQEVEVLTGLEFEVVNDRNSPYMELQQLLWDGDALFISEKVRTSINKNDYLWPKSVILNDQYVLVSSEDYPNVNLNEIISLRIGVKKASAHSELFVRWFPEHRDIHYFDNSDDELDALVRGEVDMVMMSLYELLHLTSYKEMGGYKANYMFDISFVSTFAFNKHENVLCSVIDKTIEEINIKEITGNWLNKTHDYRAQIAEARVPWMIGVIILLALTLLLIITLFLRKQKAEQLALDARIREESLNSQNVMLDTLNRLKNEFYQNMNHDMKTPLTVISTDILNATDFFEFNMEKEDAQNSLSHAQTEIMRMARMIDNALSNSFLQENKGELEPLDIGFYLQEGAKNYRALLEGNGNRLTFDIPQNLPMILGNPDTLLHILSNLLTNANNYTRKGEINIRVTADDDRISVTVQDTGIGIKPELLNHIFERGVSDSGTGLGLPICKSAIEFMGGDISVRSKYGHGTVVTFTLPIYKEIDLDG
ncbi:MAG TPA: transporter substrate-binding domain-containing protein [Clostridiaceae bacterium]|nr:transporter substrate-binding domain-containing protein [Clostridiaceae bacterium]